MSHLIVEIPKRGPGKDNWIYVIAENWIENEVLYLPDSKYSNTYKNQILKCGAPPDVESWDRHDVFKIVGTFATYDEARTNLPRVESGLPILNDSNTGRGQREKKKKKFSMPGETTTDMESDEEESVGPARRKLASKMPKNTSPKRSCKRGTSFPLPPTGLLVAKRSTNLSSRATQGTNSDKESCSNSNAEELPSSNLMDISNNTMGRLHTEASSSTVEFSCQQVFQPGNTICRLGNTDASASNMDLSTQKTIQPGTFFHQGGYEDSYGIHQTAGNCSQTGFYQPLLLRF